MSSVVIEGSLFPAAGVLARGERATVAYTPRIKGLVERGHIVVVEYLDDDDVEVTELEEVNETEGEQLLTGDQVEVPKRNASEETWKAFFTASGLEFPEDAGRDDLVAAWVQIEQQRAGGS